MPFLTSNLLLAAAEREPNDKSVLGLSMFYGLHVVTAKPCWSVSVAEKLNIKQVALKDPVMKSFGKPVNLEGFCL